MCDNDPESAEYHWEERGKERSKSKSLMSLLVKRQGFKKRKWTATWHVDNLVGVDLHADFLGKPLEMEDGVVESEALHDCLVEAGVLLRWHRALG